ncbi:MAG: hypothetical protein ACREU9_10440 [Gammaproteobacteria bacterium]
MAFAAQLDIDISSPGINKLRTARMVVSERRRRMEKEIGAYWVGRERAGV